MIAVEIREPGGPDVLVAVDRPVPVPAAGEVLVKVAAAGVNRPDVFQRLGNYPPPPGRDRHSGSRGGRDGRATRRQASPTGRSAIGCARWSAGGGYAEYCVAPAPQCLPIPRGLDFVTAAAIPETFFTVWTNVFQRGRLAAGESILVHGGSSGIGTTAIQLARARGARVFATAGSPDKCAACERLGAERAINYRAEDFVAGVRGLTGGHGVDVILDMVGGDYFARNIDALALEGRLVEIATLHGVKAELNIQTDHAAAADHHRIDAARAVGRAKKARSLPRFASTSGRCSSRRRPADHPRHVCASRRRRGAPRSWMPARMSASWC